ncbi:hypothetical protein BH18ACT12_BH18ACT12_23240 [soil metagenome]
MPAPRLDSHTLGRRPIIPAEMRLAVAFVGSVVPDEARFHTRAFNRAGNTFQLELLKGLGESLLGDLVVLSVRPIPAFPGSTQLFLCPCSVALNGGLLALLLPFVNITPLKQLTLGLATLAGILWWGLRNRGRRRVVYTYNLSVPTALFTLIGARLIGGRAIANLNDVNKPGQTVPDSALWRLDYWLQRRLAPRFDGHVVVADAIARDLLHGRTFLRVEGGVSPQLMDRPRGANREVSRGRFVITFAGTLNEANGIVLILAAFRMLDARYTLRVAGSGPLEAMLREAAGRDPRLDYRGQLAFSDLLELYDDSDLLVNLRLTKAIDTSYFFPSKLIEFLATGVPVVTTNTGHVGEEFGGFVFLLEDENARGLADLITLVSAMDKAARNAIAQKARAYVVANKSWEVQARKVAVYVRRVAEIGP